MAHPVYKSLIRSIIDYLVLVYRTETKKNTQFIENMQRRTTRIIPELRGLAYKQRIEALNLPKLLYRTQKYNMIQISTIIHNLENVLIDKYFHLNDNITTGQVCKLVVPRTN